MDPLTFVYKRVENLDISFDLYPPLSPYSVVGSQVRVTGIADIQAVPAVVYFHGGGMTVGTRKSWFPTWLHRVAFISADYRLMPPATGHEILSDILSLLNFVRHSLNPLLSRRSPTATLLQIDSARIAVVGSSAGGLCSYLAAAHAAPKPKAVLSMYGLGGSFLTPHYLAPKLKPFFRGRELLDASSDTFAPFLHPSVRSLPSTAGSELAYKYRDSMTPAYPANPRMLLARLYLQQGTFLDYWTGLHAPSLSETLRTQLEDADRCGSAIPHESRTLFPELLVSKDWPPTFLVHGELDSAVPLADSRNMCELLKGANVDVQLRVVEGQEHSFDYQADADDEGKFKSVFDEAVDFLIGALHSGVCIIT
ncbi:hypothetical protein EW146_g3980 [Bondarzewia mesenterica]|uniref:Uncharacterized protein n=1 Tax=Bondarzewia mesenterica TaxID=1095465 RepID=A0A4S4LW54_9AGAM|nr:hypothetical protein EW146_g3980 [Bondarzewia mesenterica]